MRRPPSLTEGSVSRTLIVFALPLLAGNILQSLNGSVNAVWVGKYLGEAALTATANAGSVLFLLLGGVFGMSMAATILVGQYIGSGRHAEAKHVVGSSATFFAVLSLLIAVVGALTSERLLRAMSTPPDALPLAIEYMRVIFYAVPPLYMFAFIMSVLRGAGDSRTPFAFLLLAVVLDIALNPLLIFGWGPIPALHIAGSAWATFIANVVSLVALITFLYRTRNPLCLHRDELAQLKPDPAIIGTLLKKGIPMGLQMVVISMGGILMITLVNRFGTDTAAAFGAAWQVWNYVQMPAFAIGMAVSSMAAQNVGAGSWDRVARVAKVGVVANFVMTGLLVVVIELFSRQALGLFLPAGSPALAIAVHLNLIVAWSFIFFGVSFVLFGVVRATGAVMPPLIILFVCMILFRYPFALVLMDAWQANAIWWSFVLSAILAAGMALAYYKYGGWRKARMVPAGRPAVS